MQKAIPRLLGSGFEEFESAIDRAKEFIMT